MTKIQKKVVSQIILEANIIYYPLSHTKRTVDPIDCYPILCLKVLYDRNCTIILTRHDIIFLGNHLMHIECFFFCIEITVMPSDIIYSAFDLQLHNLLGKISGLN